MAETDPEPLKTVTIPSGIFSRQVRRGYVVVDSVDGCIQGLVNRSWPGSLLLRCLKLGQIHKEAYGGMGGWLRSGYVIYKSVYWGIPYLSRKSHLTKLPIFSTRL